MDVRLINVLNHICFSGENLISPVLTSTKTASYGLKLNRENKETFVVSYSVVMQDQLEIMALNKFTSDNVVSHCISNTRTIYIFSEVNKYKRIIKFYVYNMFLMAFVIYYGSKSIDLQHPCI